MATKPNSITNNIKSSFSLYFKSLKWTIPLAFIFSALGYFMQPNGKPTVAEPMDAVMLVLFLLALYFAATFHVAILVTLKAISDGKTPSLFDSIVAGLKRAIGVCIVGLLIEIIAGIPGAIVYMIILKLVPAQPILGFLIAMVVALYILIYIYFAPFIYALGESGIIASIKESFHLVYHHFWWACLLMTILSLIALVATFALFAIFSPLLSWLYSDYFVLSMLLMFVLMSILIPYWYSLILVIIQDLQRKAGVPAVVRK